MSRPPCCRRIAGRPPCAMFKPAGVPAVDLEKVTLGLDEMEALRLADLEGLYQEDAARRMNVSRQTFGRILEAAHRKVAGALAEGKALLIEGGKVEMAPGRTFGCRACKTQWKEPSGKDRPRRCPQCRREDVFRVPGKGKTRSGRSKTKKTRRSA
jgi:uncharacterized protein